MRETQLSAKFKRNINLKCKKAGLPFFYYKIPDCKGLGNLRPFDGFLMLAGKTFAIEFKVGKNKLEPHQKYCLDQVKKTGNRALVIRETDVDSIIEQIISTCLVTRAILKKYGNSFKKQSN